MIIVTMEQGSLVKLIGTHPFFHQDLEPYKDEIGKVVALQGENVLVEFSDKHKWIPRRFLGIVIEP